MPLTQKSCFSVKSELYPFLYILSYFRVVLVVWLIGIHIKLEIPKNYTPPSSLKYIYASNTALQSITLLCSGYNIRGGGVLCVTIYAGVFSSPLLVHFPYYVLCMIPSLCSKLSC